MKKYIVIIMLLVASVVSAQPFYQTFESGYNVNVDWNIANNCLYYPYDVPLSCDMGEIAPAIAWTIWNYVEYVFIPEWQRQRPWLADWQLRQHAQSMTYLVYDSYRHWDTDLHMWVYGSYWKNTIAVSLYKGIKSYNGTFLVGVAPHTVTYFPSVRRWWAGYISPIYDIPSWLSTEIMPSLRHEFNHSMGVHH